MSDRLLAARVITFAAAVPVLMRLPLERVARWITPSGDAGSDLPRTDAVALVQRIDGWLLRGRPLVRAGCVTRSLTRYRFLRRAGVAVSLHFGIGAVNSAFEAHCWIAYNDEPLCERRDPRATFTEMWTIPS